MTPEQAISLLTAWQKGEAIPSFEDIDTAINLAIEIMSASLKDTVARRP